jgi:YD repeat-containing protein
MKKALSLLLALVMCLFLCACGENTPTDTSISTNGSNVSSSMPTDTEGTTETSIATTAPEKTESEEEKMQKLNDYNKAIDLLGNIDTYYTPEQIGDMSEAYNLLVALGDYEDAPDVRACFAECTLKVVNSTPDDNGWKYVYNTNGDLLVAFTNTSRYCTNTYDDKGRMVKVDYYVTDDTRYDEPYYGCRTYEYNEAGQLIRHEYVEQSNSYCWTYKYDTSGNEAIEYYTYNGELNRTTTITYASGLVVKERFDFDSYYNESTYTYDENGLKIEETVISSRNEDVGHYTYEYDQNGNLIKEEYTKVRNGEIIDKGTTTYTYSTIYIYTPPQS